MIKAVTVLNPDQAARVDRINAYHEGCLKSFGDQMGYAFLAGLELNAAKAELPHGKFTDWREAYLPHVEERTAQRYMKFSEALSKSDTVSDLPAAKLLTNGELSEKQRGKILAAVHEATDGKTLTQLYRDLGVIREKKPVGRQEGEKPKRLTLTEQAELRQAQATDDWDLIAKSLTAYADKFTILADDDCTAQIAALEQALNARKAWLKQPASKRDPKAIADLFRGLLPGRAS